MTESTNTHQTLRNNTCLRTHQCYKTIQSYYKSKAFDKKSTHKQRHNFLRHQAAITAFCASSWGHLSWHLNNRNCRDCTPHFFCRLKRIRKHKVFKSSTLSSTTNTHRKPKNTTTRIHIFQKKTFVSTTKPCLLFTHHKPFRSSKAQEDRWG